MGRKEPEAYALTTSVEEDDRRIERRAARLRAAGWSYTKIARSLKVSEPEAYRLTVAHLRRQLEEFPEGRGLARQLEKERLDGLQRAVSPGIRRGDHDSIHTALEIAKRRAALEGLDAPTRIQQDVRRVDIRIQAAQLRERLEALPDGAVADLCEEKVRAIGSGGGGSRAASGAARKIEAE